MLLPYRPQILHTLRLELCLLWALVQHRTRFDHMVEEVFATKKNMRRVLTKCTAIYGLLDSMITGLSIPSRPLFRRGNLVFL